MLGTGELFWIYQVLLYKTKTLIFACDKHYQIAQVENDILNSIIKISIATTLMNTTVLTLVQIELYDCVVN
jgi:hypothetical protein